jgi:hypothetical protein
MATTSHPSADFSVRVAASDAASNEDTLTDSKSYMRAMVTMPLADYEGCGIG